MQWSGPAETAPSHNGTTVTLHGLLIPGLVNTHAHTPMVLLRGAGEGLPVSRWLTEVMWPREGKLTSDDVASAMTLGAGELLLNGITTSHEMYFLADDVAKAAAAAGLRCVVTPPVLVAADLARFGTWEEQVDQMVELADKWAGDPLVTVGFGPHSAYALSEETLVESGRVVGVARDAHPDSCRGTSPRGRRSETTNRALGHRLPRLPWDLHDQSRRRPWCVAHPVRHRDPG